MRTALTFKEGDLLADRFKIVRFIDRGGMGDVYEAEDVYLHMQVAIKAIRPDLLDVPGFQERFKREVKLAKEVAHRNVCRVYDMHPVPGGEVLFVSMELLVGETLALRLKRPDRITGEEAVELIRQMAAALGAIHDKGILHRDFKPENVVLVEGNSPGTLLVKVTDFGLAFRPASRRSGSGALTTQNLILGTPEYMSPEQAQPPDQQRELTRASDIYSLGLVIYEMLTGNRPLEAVTPWGTVQRRIAETIPSPKTFVRGLRGEWEDFILKCLDREPRLRYQNVREIEDALANLPPELVQTQWLRFDTLLRPRFGWGPRPEPSGLVVGTTPGNKAPAVAMFSSSRHHSRRRPRTSVIKFSLSAAGLFLILALTAFFFRLFPHELRVRAASQLTHDKFPKSGPLFTDGARVYFTEGSGGNQALATVPVAGGDSTRLPFSLEELGVLDLSPTRSEILTVKTGSGGELWLMSVGGDSRKRFPVNDVTVAQFSPDERRIVFVQGRTLWVMNSDGGQMLRIAEIPESANWFRWSPDAKAVRFTRNEYVNGSLQQSLWEIASDGTNLHPLLPNWHNPPHECCGAWTPDGNYYVFQSAEIEVPSLWAITDRPLFAGGTREPIRLTSGLEFSHPMPSSDGKHIFAIGQKPDGELVRYVPGQGFSTYLNGISATWVTFSPSGHFVAYVKEPEKTLWRANSDGSAPVQITFAPFEMDGFSWSQDESTFAARARYGNTKWRIYLVPARTGDAPKQVTPGEEEQGIPSWSNDGAQLCFGDVPAAFGQPGGTEAIHIVDTHTGHVFDLPNSDGLWSPRWSPNGRYISALTIKGQQLELYDLEKKTWILTKAKHVSTPNWSRDSQYIYYDTEGKERLLERIRIRDGQVEEIGSLAGYPDLAPWWSGLTPDNMPLLLRNLGTPQIYSLDLQSQ